LRPSLVGGLARIIIILAIIVVTSIGRIPVPVSVSIAIGTISAVRVIITSIGRKIATSGVVSRATTSLTILATLVLR